ncbi:cytochrome P450 [Pseudonocardia pini]|uniref:cytochrome P450 n=1 Tax=Pseudonocardia pini TaxID=2758030 RepID=UPI0015F00D58|nr:cytochrome P450 [Pseudonocardia pini]
MTQEDTTTPIETDGVIGGRDHFTDFDLDSPEYTEHYDEVLDALLDRCPVARSEAFGGYWVVARAEDFKRCAVDHKTFTSTRGFEPAHGNEGDGGMKLYPLQIDPPYQTRWRQALGPYFGVKAVAPLEAGIREHADYLIDSFIERGSCDFVAEFAAQLPARVFFGSFLHVPFDRIGPIQKATDDAIRGPGEGRGAAWGIVGEFLTGYLQERAEQPPKGDFVDVVLAGVETDEGEPAPYEHKLFTMIDFLAGGIGTTSHTLASMAHHLTTRPDHVERLVAEPELRDNAVEEIIRIFAPVTALGRTATVDTEIAGQKIAAGDLVMLSEAAACRDPRVVDNPSEVELDRRVPVNLAFSYGPHRCIGAHVARLVMRTALDEVLRRMPDLKVAPGEAPMFSNSGVARNMDTLPLVFTPGAREVVAAESP